MARNGFSTPLALAAAAAIVLHAGAAFANDRDVSTTMVKYGDLDLTTQAGKKAFDRRVNRAVATVCAMPTTVGSRIRHLDETCVAQSLARADRAKTTVVARAEQRKTDRLAAAESGATAEQAVVVGR